MTNSFAISNNQQVYKAMPADPRANNCTATTQQQAYNTIPGDARANGYTTSTCQQIYKPMPGDTQTNTCTTTTQQAFNAMPGDCTTNTYTASFGPNTQQNMVTTNTVQAVNKPDNSTRQKTHKKSPDVKSESVTSPRSAPRRHSSPCTVQSPCSKECTRNQATIKDIKDITVPVPPLPNTPAKTAPNNNNPPAQQAVAFQVSPDPKHTLSPKRAGHRFKSKKRGRTMDKNYRNKNRPLSPAGSTGSIKMSPIMRNKFERKTSPPKMSARTSDSYKRATQPCCECRSRERSLSSSAVSCGLSRSGCSTCGSTFTSCTPRSDVFRQRERSCEGAMCCCRQRSASCESRRNARATCSSPFEPSCLYSPAASPWDRSCSNSTRSASCERRAPYPATAPDCFCEQRLGEFLRQRSPSPACGGRARCMYAAPTWNEGMSPVSQRSPSCDNRVCPNQPRSFSCDNWVCANQQRSGYCEQRKCRSASRSPVCDSRICHTSPRNIVESPTCANHSYARPSDSHERRYCPNASPRSRSRSCDGPISCPNVVLSSPPCARASPPCARSSCSYTGCRKCGGGAICMDDTAASTNAGFEWPCESTNRVTFEERQRRRDVPSVRGCTCSAARDVMAPCYSPEKSDPEKPVVKAKVTRVTKTKKAKKKPSSYPSRIAPPRSV